MAAGLAIVATDRGAIAETVVDRTAGFIVRDPEPPLLAEKMLCLLDEPELLRELATAARRRFEQRYTQDVADRALADWVSEAAGMAEAP
jgi:glycosyltransferase involved in cell wall biosynthesis